jgi:hypothetical protein
VTGIRADVDPCFDLEELVLVNDPGAVPEPGHSDPAGSSASDEPDRRVDESPLAIDGYIRHAMTIAPRSKRAGGAATR